jgi:hypothetical protein
MATQTPRKPYWIIHGIVVTVGAIVICAMVGAFDNSVSVAFKAFAAYGLPIAAVHTFLSFLATGGFRTPNLCGYCGYDRAGFQDSAPCPECGRAYDPNSPGYKPVGRRCLPWWLWMPALLPIPLLMLVERVPPVLQSPYTLACIGATVGGMIIAGVHSWRQVR